MTCTGTTLPAYTPATASRRASIAAAAQAARRIAAAALDWLTARPLVLSDPHLDVLLARCDDRLLRDAGLAREDVMDRWRYFRERDLKSALRRPPRRP